MKIQLGSNEVTSVLCFVLSNAARKLRTETGQKEQKKESGNPSQASDPGSFWNLKIGRHMNEGFALPPAVPAHI